jgi:hypothetical protein
MAEAELRAFLDAAGARRVAGRTPAIKSSHPDQFFPFQVNSLQTILSGHCLFVGPDCGSFAGIF